MIIVEKFALGITLAAPFGPVSLEMIKRGLNQGFWSAFNVRLGGAIGNFLCLVLAYTGLQQISNNPTIMQTAGLIGALVLVYMGTQTIRKNYKLPTAGHKKYTTLNALGYGFILAVANPVAVVFWMGIFAASMQAQIISNQAVTFASNIVIIIGVIAWGAMLAALVSFAKKYLSNKAINIITNIAGALLILFGLKYGISIILA